VSRRAPVQRASQRTDADAGLSLAALLLLTLACSGPTDIVGVLDGAEPSDGDELPSDATGATAAVEPGAAPADDDAASASDVALLLAGRPVTDWPGEALEWPLSMPLGELFADASPDSRDNRARLMPAPWPSRRVASSGSTRGSARGTSDLDARSPRFDARLLILDEAEARQLLALMTPAGGPGAELTAIFRDALGDVYQVSLESDEMPLDAIGCGGRMRRESFECTGRGPFD
jgi:hypothetical protein